MKSVGETMGIGRTFREAFVKAERGLEAPLDWQPGEPAPVVRARARARRRTSARSSRRASPSTAASTRAPARSRPSRPTTTRPGARPTRRRRTARAARRHPRQRPEPDRPGHRVRLLLRPRGAGVPRARLRGGDGQLEPGDRLDRLRHERPALLRAARRRRRCSPSAGASSREGVVIQFGGQTPLKLAAALEDAGIPILGTPFGAVDLAEDRERFGRLTDELGIRVPPWGMADDAGGGGGGRGADRLPGARAPVVRARRPRDAHLLLGRAGARRDARHRGPRARRPLPRGRGRDRRRRALRRDALLRRRRDAARRGGGRALGRLVVRAACAVARPGDVLRGLPRRAPARARRSASSAC